MQQYGKYTEAEILDFLLGASSEEMDNAIQTDIANSTELAHQVATLKYNLNDAVQTSKVRSVFAEANRRTRLRRIKQFGVVAAGISIVVIIVLLLRQPVTETLPTNMQLKSMRLDDLGRNLITESELPKLHMDDTASSKATEAYNAGRLLESEELFADLSGKTEFSDNVRIYYSYCQVASAIWSKRLISNQELTKFSAILEQYHSTYPEWSSVYYQQAIIASKQHDKEKTIDFLQKVIKNPNATNNAEIAQKELEKLNQ